MYVKENYSSGFIKKEVYDGSGSSVFNFFIRNDKVVIEFVSLDGVVQTRMFLDDIIEMTVY